MDYLSINILDLIIGYLFSREHMKLIQLHLISNGKTLGTFDLQPATLRNLKASAKRNGVSLTNMIDLAIRFTTDPEKRQTVNLVCPD
jgi:hypothetical protein